MLSSRNKWLKTVICYYCLSAVLTKHLNSISFLSLGYIIHESGVWSDIHKQWFFLPRRASRDTYEEVADERRATNLLFRTSEDFGGIQMQRMGPFNPTHGFSSFKFVPGTQDRIILALKSEEDQGVITSYATVLNIEGDVLLEEMKIGDKKYEGVEFVWGYWYRWDGAGVGWGGGVIENSRWPFQYKEWYCMTFMCRCVVEFLINHSTIWFPL